MMILPASLTHFFHTSKKEFLAKGNEMLWGNEQEQKLRFTNVKLSVSSETPDSPLAENPVAQCQLLLKQGAVPFPPKSL